MEGKGKNCRRAFKSSKSSSKSQLLMDTKVEKNFPTVTKKLVRNVDVSKPNIGVQKTIKSVKHQKCVSNEEPLKIHVNKHVQCHDKCADQNTDLTKPGLRTALQFADDIIRTVAAERNEDDSKSNFGIVNNSEETSNVKVSS